MRNPTIPPAKASKGVCPRDSLRVSSLSYDVILLSARAWSPDWYLTFIASYITMMENTRQMANTSLHTPFFIPIAVARETTKVECADGIPPLQNMRAKLNRQSIPWISHLRTIATISAMKGINMICSWRYSPKICIFFYWKIKRIQSYNPLCLMGKRP